ALSATAVAQTAPTPDPQQTGEATPAPSPADAAAPEAQPAPEAPPPPADAPPAATAPGPAVAPSAAAPSAAAEQQRFEQFRHDLINLLALRAEPDLLVAAAELAYPDAEDKKRPAVLKSPALIKRAQKYGPDSALVWWISTFLCGAKAEACQSEAVTK